jgi:BMFP domain-containing protein YqiC
MNKKDGIIHDISKIASSAFSSITAMKREISIHVQNLVSELLKKANFVKKHDFEVLHKMVVENRKIIDEVKSHLGYKNKEDPQKKPINKIVVAKSEGNSSKPAKTPKVKKSTLVEVYSKPIKVKSSTVKQLKAISKKHK